MTCILPQPSGADMAGSWGLRSDAKPIVHMLGVALCSLLLATASSESAGKARQRRSDDYDNLDNFLMGSADYDNFFLKTAKSVPRIGRRSGGSEGEPVHVDRRSTDANELVPSYSQGYDHFFLKASKSVPRIGKRNDEFFMKTAKSVPRIGRRSGDGPDNFLLRGREGSDFLKTAKPTEEAAPASGQRVERRSQVEESEWRDGVLGGNDGLPGHRVQRRHYADLAARAKTAPRMGKRMHPTLDEVGDWGTEQQWPWFRQPDSSPGPHKRANPADLIDLSEVPWESLDLLLRGLAARRGQGGQAGQADDGAGQDVVLLQDKQQGGDRWLYYDKRPSGSKELAEVRLQPDVRK